MIEIEKRYKVLSVEATIAELEKRGLVVTSSDHIVDRWFVPETVHSLEDEGRWFDDDMGLAYRIRQRTLEDGSESVVLDSKQLLRPHDHSAFKEDIVISDNRASAEQYVADKHYYNWLTIDKTRLSFSSPNSSLLVTLDTVKGLKDELGFDSVLEIEYDGEAESEEAANSVITKLADELGLNEKDLYEKSLTVEAKPVLAQFK